MAESAPYAALCRAELRLEFLHANSTTHDFLFGAVAELIDNSGDAVATRLDIYTVNNENLQGGFTLCILDNGCGMTPCEATDIVHFGSSKQTNPKMIGRYGNGLKLLLGMGTLLVIYNLKLTFNGEPELGILTDVEDILIDGTPENYLEQRSVRAYTAILYLNPRMRIFIQAEKVKTKHLPYCFYRSSSVMGLLLRFTSQDFTGFLESNPSGRAVSHPVATGSFSRPTLVSFTVDHCHCLGLLHCCYQVFNELSVANGATGRIGVPSLLVNSCMDMKGESVFLKKLLFLFRNMRRPKKLFITFGVNIQNRSQNGMLICSNNRLIRMFEKLGPQKYVGLFGAGDVGFIDVPLDIMEPAHNKQTFANIKEYNHLLKSMEKYLIQYWKEMGISQKGEMLFRNDFGYLSDKWYERPSETVQYKRRRAAEIPDVNITKPKMIQTLTSHIKEILLYFLPECDISREHITSLCPEDILSMFRVSEHLNYIKKKCMNTYVLI
ncbi:LOW QUALITY PROTEIN: MORC family CW-type zinc finger protein 1 [Liasis olivaceus]